MEKPHLGFIGIGVMGTPMSGHLAGAGYPLTIHDIERSRAESVTSTYRNITIADIPREGKQRQQSGMLGRKYYRS